MIKISGKMDKQTLSTDSAILLFRSLFKKKLHEISKLLNPLSVLVYLLFPLFFYHFVRFTKIYLFSAYIYTYILNTLEVTLFLNVLELICLPKVKLFKYSLIVWVLWHINLCRSFNAKSIFIQINSSISNDSV